MANTIFPAQLARTAPDPQALYDRYQAILPRLRQCSKKNSRGLYFARLLDYPLRPTHAFAAPINQLEIVIRDLAGELARPNPLRFVYEVQIFAPGKDRRPIGFPCMSSLSFQLDGRQLRLSVTYRNQYYIQKALGNFLGLAHLQSFVAGAVGLDQGPLTVHAFHAQIDPDVGQRDAERLIRACRRCGQASPLPVEAA